jgi:aminopeptidase N
MLNKIIILIISIFTSLQIVAQNKSQTYVWEDEKYARERLIDMERMVVDVTFDPPAGLVKGQVSHFFKPLRKSIDSVFFDAPKIDIKAVFVNGKKANFKTNTDGVTVLFERPLSMGNKR